MSGENALVEKSEGARQIEKFCSDTAKDLGLKLENMYWSFDIVETPEGEKHILNVDAKSGATEMRFSRAEIEAYATRDGAEKTNKKLKAELIKLL